MLTPGDFADNLPRLPRIFSRAYIAERIDIVDQVMRHFGAFGACRLGGSNLKPAVHGHRIAIDDFAGEMPREREGKRGLTAGGWTEHDDQERRLRWRQLES